MLQHFQMSEGLLSRYSRLLYKTVIPFQDAVLNEMRVWMPVKGV